MDIENVWQQSSGSDDALNKMFQQKDFSNLQSKLPLNKLKRNLVIGIVFAVLITAFYFVVIFYVDLWQVYVSLVTLSLFNIFIAYDSWKLYNSINVNISTTNSLKEELQEKLQRLSTMVAYTGKIRLICLSHWCSRGFYNGRCFRFRKTG
jgi:hypothetical protein